MGEDFAKVRSALECEGYNDGSAALRALARLEAEHQRVVEENQRLRADSERLRKALLKSCSMCHGAGTYEPHCPFCADSGHGHECPAPVQCTHPYLPDFVRTP